MSPREMNPMSFSGVSSKVGRMSTKRRIEIVPIMEPIDVWVLEDTNYKDRKVGTIVPWEEVLEEIGIGITCMYSQTRRKLKEKE